MGDVAVCNVLLSDNKEGVEDYSNGVTNHKFCSTTKTTITMVLRKEFLAQSWELHVL